MEVKNQHKKPITALTRQFRWELWKARTFLKCTSGLSALTMELIPSSLCKGRIEQMQQFYLQYEVGHISLLSRVNASGRDRRCFSSLAIKTEGPGDRQVVKRLHSAQSQRFSSPRTIGNPQETGIQGKTLCIIRVKMCLTAVRQTEGEEAWFVLLLQFSTTLSQLAHHFTHHYPILLRYPGACHQSIP